MPVFHPLAVRDVRRETDDTVSIAFDVPADLADAYAFAAGQHLTIRMRGPDGDEVRRSYSICSAPHEGELRVAVKHLPGGVFGAYANTRLRPGEVLDVMTPAGRFTTRLDPAGAKHYLGIAAGSGITPVISLLKAILETEPASRFTLVYGNRGVSSIIFRDELDDLKNRFLGRLHVVHLFSREAQEVPLLNGRVSGDKVRELARALIDVASVDDAFVCGPEPMTLEVRDTLVELGVDPRHVHLELFGTVAPSRVPPSATADTGPRRHLTIVLNGVKTEVEMAASQTVLEAGEAAGLELPFSCRAGVCSTCRAKVCDGAVEMDRNYALEPWEVEAGFVLTCQSRPTADALTVDYDAT
jgi:ring-1,2-phenylacetyl-CoA epoxidase subunit PaaE